LQKKRKGGEQGELHFLRYYPFGAGVTCRSREKKRGKRNKRGDWEKKKKGRRGKSGAVSFSHAL